MQINVDEMRARDELVRGAVTFLKDAEGANKDPEKVRLARRILDASDRINDVVDEVAAEWTRLRSGGATQAELDEMAAPYLDKLHEIQGEIDGVAQELAGIAEGR